MLGSEGLGLGSVGTAAEAGKAAAIDPHAITIEAAYANGADARHTWDVMHQPSGNLRFDGDTGSGGISSQGYFESATTPADPRVGSIIQRRYYPTAQLIGGFNILRTIGFDPLWNGLFANLGNVAIESERVSFTNDADETTAHGTTIGSMVWQQTGGFFDGPQAYPTPGFNSGHREDFEIFLFNGFDEALFSHPSWSVSGWGQGTLNTLSTTQGVITAAMNLSWWPRVAPLAGDGVGLFFSLGTDDPPKGLISNTMLTADTHGQYQLGFFTASAVNTLGTPICTMDWTNGIQFHAPVATPAGAVLQPGVTIPGVADFELTGITFNEPLHVDQTNLDLGGGTFGSVVSIEVDLTVVGPTVIKPALPGKLFIPLRFWTAAITQNTGVATGAGTISIGNNATADNLFSAAIGANFIATAWVNGGPGTLNESSFPASPFPTVGPFDLVVKVITPPTGPTVCKARFLIDGFYI